MLFHISKYQIMKSSISHTPLSQSLKPRVAFVLLGLSFISVLVLTPLILIRHKDIPSRFNSIVKSGSASPTINSFAISKHLRFLYNLQHFERKVYSQNGEDGVIEYIFQNLGTKVCVIFSTALGLILLFNFIKSGQILR